MKPSLVELVPAHIRAVVPYQPGKPVEEVERELGITAIKLASNENPLGPSPLAVQAAQRALAEANRYPDGGCYYLRRNLAARYGLPMEQVFVGLGSSEVIDLAARTLLGPGLEALSSAGTYPPYEISTLGAGARMITAPLRDYRYDLEAIALRVTPRTRVIYLANPNNPTGTSFHADAFEVFLAVIPKQILVVLDEAYYDYVDDPAYTRSIEMLKARHNLLVTRTFSKVYGLAGLRVGYGLGPADLLSEFHKLRTPFNTAGVGQIAALAALDDHEHVHNSVEANRAGRQQLERGLAALGARFVPSSTNFVFVETGADGHRVADELLRAGVIVRPMGWMGFPGAIRISVGTPPENDRFLEAFAKVRAQADLLVSPKK